MYLLQEKFVVEDTEWFHPYSSLVSRYCSKIVLPFDEDDAKGDLR